MIPRRRIEAARNTAPKGTGLRESAQEGEASGGTTHTDDVREGSCAETTSEALADPDFYRES